MLLSALLWPESEIDNDPDTKITAESQEKDYLSDFQLDEELGEGEDLEGTQSEGEQDILLEGEEDGDNGDDEEEEEEADDEDAGEEEEEEVKIYERNVKELEEEMEIIKIEEETEEESTETQSNNNGNDKEGEVNRLYGERFLIS